MPQLEKIAQQLTLVYKALEVAQSLCRINRVSWTEQLGGKMKLGKRTHSWKDLRLCCHDLRPIFITTDPMHRDGLRGVLGPIKKRNNNRVFYAGLRMLKSSALLEGRDDRILREDVPCGRLDEHGYLIEYQMPGYIHSPGYLATAYIYGRWSHGHRAVDLNAMSERFGQAADFETLTRFTFNAGHGFLAIMVAFAEEKLGTETPEIGVDSQVVTHVPSVVKKLRAVASLLRAEAKKLPLARPKTVHMRPF